MTYLFVSCQALLLLLFVASAVGKVSGPAAWRGFRDSVRALGLVPDRLGRAVAATVVAAELAVAPMLVSSWAAPVGLALAGVLLTAFTGAIARSLRRGVTAACRCFGPSEIPLGRRHLVRNGLLLGVVAVGAWSLASTPVAPHPAGLAIAVLAGLLGATVLVFFDGIVELFIETAVVRGREERSTS